MTCAAPAPAAAAAAAAAASCSQYGDAPPSDLRPHALELRPEQRGRPAFQRRRLLTVGDLLGRVAGPASDLEGCPPACWRAAGRVDLLLLQAVRAGRASPESASPNCSNARAHVVSAGQRVHRVHEALTVDENRRHRSVVGELVDVDEDHHARVRLVRPCSRLWTTCSCAARVRQVRCWPGRAPVVPAPRRPAWSLDGLLPTRRCVAQSGRAGAAQRIDGAVERARLR